MKALQTLSRVPRVKPSPTIPASRRRIFHDEGSVGPPEARRVLPVRRIAYLLDVYPVVSETFVFNEIRLLRERGATVEVFALNGKQNSLRGLRELEKDCYYLERDSPARALRAHARLFFAHPRRYLRLIWLARRFRGSFAIAFKHHLSLVQTIELSGAEVIHSHFAARASDLALMVNIATGVPFTFTSHRYDIFERPLPSLKLKSELAAKHVTVSDYNSDYLQSQFGIAPASIRVVHCGVDTEYWKGPLRDFDWRHRPVRLISVARLVSQKNIAAVLDACASLRARRVPFECEVIGGGDLRDELEKQRAQLRLGDTVVFSGALPSSEVRRRLIGVDVFLLPSYSEGIPISLMEAMSAGVISIASDITGVPEIIDHRRSGYLVHPDEPEMIADAVEELRANPELAERIARVARATVRAEFDLRGQVDGLAAVWNETVAG